MTDGNGLIYLRARYYEPEIGRFISKDVWLGDSNNPLSLNSWLYAYSNPIRYYDPSGFISQDEANIIHEWLLGYGVEIQKDWGYGYEVIRKNPWLSPVIPRQLLCDWFGGYWRSIDELNLVKDSVIRSAIGLKGVGRFKSAMGHVKIARWGSFPDSPAFAPPGPASIIGDIVLPDYHFNQTNEYSVFNLIHEFGHVWDGNVLGRLSSGLQSEIGTLTCQLGGRTPVCWFDIDAGKEKPPGHPDDPYAGTSSSRFEDWAESFATYIYPKYYQQFPRYLDLGPLRKQYVMEQINALP
jgi:RHS repeat-associated protein